MDSTRLDGIQTLRKLFKRFDTNQDGVLSKGEVLEVMKIVRKSHIPPTQQELDACFAEMDSNRDLMVQEEEFVKVLSHWIGNWEELASPKEKRRLEEAPEAVHQKKKLNHVMEFFDSFIAPTDFSDFVEEQRRFYSRPREEYDWTSLLFGLDELSAPEVELLTRRFLHYNQNFETQFYQIKAACWSKTAPVVIEGLQTVRQLLQITKVFKSVAQKLAYAPSIYDLFIHITDNYNPHIQMKGGADSEKPGEVLGPIVDRLVQLIDLDASAHPQLAQIQLEAIRCLHYYIIGPRIPVRNVKEARTVRQWYSSEYPRTVVMSKGALEKFIRVLSANQTVNEFNAELLTEVIACIGALADGRGPCWLRTISDSARIRDTVVTYLSSPVVGSSPKALELFHACAATLSILCGHSSEGYHQPSGATNPAVVFKDIQELNNVLKVVERLLQTFIATTDHEVNEKRSNLMEASIVHLLTVICLTLPITSTHLIFGHCDILISKFSWALRRQWHNLDASKVAKTRINQCMRDLMESAAAGGAAATGAPKDTMANWLLSRDGGALGGSLRGQLELGGDDQFYNVVVSALKVIDDFVTYGLGDFVIEHYYTSLLYLLNLPEVQHWAMNSLLHWYRSNKSSLMKVLKRGFVDALFQAVLHLKEFPRLSDPFCHAHIVDTLYHLPATRDIVKVLLDILSISAADVRDDRFTTTVVSVFQVHHIETVRYLHLLICNEIESGRLDPKDDQLQGLLQELVQLLGRVRELHAFSAIHDAMSFEIDDLLAGWVPKLNEAVNKIVAKTAPAAMMVVVEEEAQMVAKRLPLPRSYVGAKEVQVLIKPQQWFVEGTQVERPERLFVFPYSVSLDDMLAALTSYYARAIRLFYVPATTSASSAVAGPLLQGLASHTRLATDEELRALIAASPPGTRLHLVVRPPAAGEASEVSLVSKAPETKSSQEIISELWKDVPIETDGDSAVLNDLFEKYKQKCGGKSELDVELFVSIFAENGISEQVSRPLFRAFDRDYSGTVSWKEFSTGLAKAKSPKHQLAIAFNAYDADGDGKLDFDETVELCHAHLSHASMTVARELARDCFAHLHLDMAAGDTMNFKQFEYLLNAHHIALDSLLPPKLREEAPPHVSRKDARHNRSHSETGVAHAQPEAVPYRRERSASNGTQHPGASHNKHKPKHAEALRVDRGGNAIKCKYFFQGSCKKGEACSFSHTE